MSFRLFLDSQKNRFILLLLFRRWILNVPERYKSVWNKCRKMFPVQTALNDKCGGGFLNRFAFDHRIRLEKTFMILSPAVRPLKWLHHLSQFTVFLLKTELCPWLDSTQCGFKCTSRLLSCVVQELLPLQHGWAAAAVKWCDSCPWRRASREWPLHEPD